MTGKEGERTIGFLSFFTRLAKRIKAGPVLDKTENTLAYDTMLEMSRLRRRQEFGTDDFPKEKIRWYLQKLNGDGFFCGADSDGESTLTQSEDGNKVIITTDTGLKISVKGIERGNLNLFIGGKNIPVPNSDPHYLEPMIVREMLRVEMK